MKFTITRTSEWGVSKTPPTKSESVSPKKEEITRKRYNGEEYKEKEWTVEIRSLKQLLQLVNDEECKQIVISTDAISGMPEIEIYDDYRE